MLRRRRLLLLPFLATSLLAQPQAPKQPQTAGQKSRAAMAQLEEATPASAIQIAPGFKVELLYTVPKADQGSWVALTPDPKGRLIASDQYGGLYRLTVPAIGTSTGTKIEKLDIDFTKIVRLDAGELLQSN